MATSAGGPTPTSEEESTVRDRSTVSFSELAWARWLAGGMAKDSGNEGAARNFASCLEAFERAYGPIVEAFWGRGEASAVVLTKGRRRPLGGLLGKETAPRLHVAADWLSESPRAAELLYRCEELAIRVSVLLVGVQRRIALSGIFEIAAHVLGLREHASKEAKREQVEPILERMDAELRSTEKYFDQASKSITRLRYVRGMLLGLLIVGVAAIVAEFAVGSTATVDRATASVAAGALGAVASVMQRMTANRFGLPNDLDRAWVVSAGALRTFVGAVFGAFVYFSFAAQFVVVLPTSSNSSTVYTYALTAFLAGFAERWLNLLLEPVASLGAEEVVERTTVAVEESVRATLLGPVLARWHGFVSVSIDGKSGEDGPPLLHPLEQTELTIAFGQEEAASAFERPIEIREGEEAPEVPFTLRLDSETVTVPFPEQTLAVPAGGGAKTTMSFTAPQAPGSHVAWLRVSQRNRVVQMVPLEFEVRA